MPNTITHLAFGQILLILFLYLLSVRHGSIGAIPIKSDTILSDSKKEIKRGKFREFVKKVKKVY